MYQNGRVRLRDLRIDDANSVVQWFDDATLRRQIHGGAPAPIGLETEQEWIRQHMGPMEDQQHYAIETMEGEFIGVCSYSDVCWRNRNCKVGWFLGAADMRGRGYGTDMIRLLLNICFEELGMHKVSLDVFSYNEGAIRLYERLGFVREATKREHVFTQGKYWDEYTYSMLEGEYRRRNAGEAET